MSASFDLASPLTLPHETRMSKLPKSTAAIAGAIGSAAIAAALLYAGKRKQKTDRNKPRQPGAIPSGEAPETD